MLVYFSAHISSLLELVNPGKYRISFNGHHFFTVLLRKPLLEIYAVVNMPVELLLHYWGYFRNPDTISDHPNQQLYQSLKLFFLEWYG